MDTPYALYSTPNSSIMAGFSSSAEDQRLDHGYYHDNNYYYYNNNNNNNNNYYYAQSFPQSPPAGCREDRQVVFCPSGGSSSVSDAASTAPVAGLLGKEEDQIGSEIRAKISAHPLYPRLIQAYIDCQKVGAPAEMAFLLEEMSRQSHLSHLTSFTDGSRLGADPELDDFMERYYDILVNYKWDLWRPFDEATTFLTDIQSQFHTLCADAPPSSTTPHVSEGGVMIYGEDDIIMAGGEVVDAGSGQQLNDEQDGKLKDRLLEKYGGCLSRLKHEFSKKKKKGKLPKEARLLLLDWWNLHYKWPYPTEADKVELAKTTGLDQKQINNWFINQRKRHWKPTDNMHSSVMDALYGSSSFLSHYPSYNYLNP